MNWIRPDVRRDFPNIDFGPEDQNDSASIRAYLTYKLGPENQCDNWRIRADIEKRKQILALRVGSLVLTEKEMQYTAYLKFVINNSNYGHIISEIVDCYNCMIWKIKNGTIDDAMIDDFPCYRKLMTLINSEYRLCLIDNYIEKLCETTEFISLIIYDPNESWIKYYLGQNYEFEETFNEVHGEDNNYSVFDERDRYAWHLRTNMINPENINRVKKGWVNKLYQGLLNGWIMHVKPNNMNTIKLIIFEEARKTRRTDIIDELVKSL